MNKQLKLLYLHNVHIESTAANLVQVISMCNAFSQAGYLVTLVLGSRSMDETSGRAFLDQRFSLDNRVQLCFIRRRFPQKIQKHVSFLYLGRIIRRINPDLLFVRDPRFFKAALHSRRPVILELHHIRMHIGNRILNHVFERWILKGAQKKQCIKVVAVSHALSDFWIKKGIAGDKIMALHDGFSPELFGQELPREAARKTLDLPMDRKIVVYSGNLQPNRGIEYILQLADYFHDVLFLLVGGDPDRKKYYERVCFERHISNIQLVGHQPHNQVPVYLQAADILLAMWSDQVPTIQYCSPLKVFEYLMAGIPMVVPGYPTILEVVEDRVDSFVAQPDNPQSFREILQLALQADEATREEITANARQKAIKQYSWDHRAAALIRQIPNALRP